MLNRAEMPNIANPREPVRYGDLTLSLSPCTLSRGDRSIDLRFAEGFVLRSLMYTQGKITRYDVLLKALSANPAGGKDRMPLLRAIIFALRSRLRVIEARTIIQVSARNGYYLVPPAVRIDHTHVTFDGFAAARRWVA